jgi:hypothetical protein
MLNEQAETDDWIVETVLKKRLGEEVIGSSLLSLTLQEDEYFVKWQGKPFLLFIHQGARL